MRQPCERGIARNDGLAEAIKTCAINWLGRAAIHSDFELAATARDISDAAIAIGAGPRVAHVLGSGTIAEVRDAIVPAVPIDVVDFSLRPFTMDVKPRKAVFHVTGASDPDLPITLVIATGALTRLEAIGR